MLRKPRILIIGTVDQRGGAARVGWDVGETLRSRGYSVKYIVGYKQSDSPHVYELHRPKLLSWLDHVTGKNMTGYLKYLRSFLLANDIDFGATTEIFNHPWYKSADIIHFHNLHGSFFRLHNLVRMSTEKKLIWTLHDMWAVSGNCVYTSDAKVWRQGAAAHTRLMEYPPMLWHNARYLWEQKRSIYQSSQLNLVVPSRWLFTIIRDQSILAGQPLRLIPNGIDAQTFSPQKKTHARHALNLPLKQKIVIFVAQGGIHEPRKGWQYIDPIVNATEFQDVLFLCVGGGAHDQNNQLPNVQYIPYITDKLTLAAYYAAADAFLFTSVAENCPLVVLEAMACGTPVVSFDVGGVSELVQHRQTGYIAKYLNIQDLSKGLTYLLSLPPSQARLVQNHCRDNVVTHFSVARMCDQYEKLYLSLC